MALPVPCAPPESSWRERMRPICDGVDFGTSNTVIAVVDEHRVSHVLPLVIGRPIEFAGASPNDALAQSRLDAAFALVGHRPDQVRLEPEAAAYAFARTTRGRHLVLVADLGGGTSDFSVVQVDADEQRPTITPLAQTGIGIAGDRFDYSIVYNAVCPSLGMGSSFRPESKPLPIPHWCRRYGTYSHENSVQKSWWAATNSHLSLRVWR